MNVIISNYPEDLEVPQEYVENVTAAAQKVGELYGVENGEVSITLTNNDYIHELNRQYRGIDRPTDVLSFALNESEEPEVTGGADLNVLGDLVISVERAEEQAKDFGHSVKREMIGRTCSFSMRSSLLTTRMTGLRVACRRSRM